MDLDTLLWWFGQADWLQKQRQG
jgi:hypothetical protein